MGARSFATLGVALALASGLLAACGGSDSTSEPAAVPALSAAESTVGASMLPPDGSVASAAALSTSQLPPDATASVAAADLPPAP